MRDNDIYLWIHRHLGEKGKLSIEAVKSEFDKGSHNQNFAEEYLNLLTRNDIVERRSSGDYTVVDEDAERAKYYGLLNEPRGSSERSNKVEGVHQPVMSVPSQLQREWEEFAETEGIDHGVTIREALRRVFDSASDTIRIVAPYFELDGLNLLNDEFGRLAEDEVAVKILTRETLTDDDSYWKNRRRKALLEAMQRYHSSSEEGLIEVRDYYFAIGTKNPKLDRSIHAKMAIADEATAYVGSGEIRDSSMHLNGEVGYLTEESAEINGWTGYFDFFWERSDTVSEDDLMSR